MEVLKQELVELLSRNMRSLRKARGIRGRGERIDALTVIMRQVLLESSLCYIGGNLCYYDGKRYVPIERETLLMLLSNVLVEAEVGASDARNMNDMPLAVLVEKNFAADGRYLSFENCIYDTWHDRVLEFSPQYRSIDRMGYDYNAYMGCPLWNKFLEEVLPDDQERSCLQEFFGMCYVDRQRYSIEKFALFIGGGSNGKSVVFDVMRGVMGADSISYLSSDQLADNKQLVEVEGKRLNFAPDMRKSAAFDSALKALSSGQSVTAWRLYEGAVTIRCPPLAFALNELPVFRDLTDAFFRRILIFGFDVTIPEEKQDRMLAHKILENEKSAIFRWIMDGRKRLEQNKGYFTVCKKMNDALKELRKNVTGERYPVMKYLASIGYAIVPQYDGQMFKKVGASVIYEGMGGGMSKDAITRELTRLGVRQDRGTERRYFLYPMDDNV